jgi:hypothetical protein
MAEGQCSAVGLVSNFTAVSPDLINCSLHRSRSLRAGFPHKDSLNPSAAIMGQSGSGFCADGVSAGQFRIAVASQSGSVWAVERPTTASIAGRSSASSDWCSRLSRSGKLIQVTSVNLQPRGNPFSPISR